MKSIQKQIFPLLVSFFFLFLVACGSGGGGGGPVDPELDTTPAVFSFTSITDAEPNTEIDSESIVITGINTASPISVAGGQYSINGGSFTSSNGTVQNNQQVVLRLISGTFEAETSATLTVGGVSGTFTVTSRAADTTPEPFSFEAQTNVEPDTEIDSSPATITGLEEAAVVSISGGAYSIDGGNFTSVDGTIENDQEVVVRVTSGTFASSSSAILTIGGVEETFTVTTREINEDITPDEFSFASVNEVLLDIDVDSESVIITGLASDSMIRISGGSYSIDGGNFTTTDGTISNNQTVVVKVTASSEFSTATYANLSIGDFNTEFTVTTKFPFLFRGYDNSGVGTELWGTDGTENGTKLIKDINQADGDGVSLNQRMFGANGEVYFQAKDGISGSALYKYIVATGESVRVKDINPEGTHYSGDIAYNSFTELNGVLYFVADDGNGYELWKSDGTEAGTVIVKDLNPGEETGVVFSFDDTLFVFEGNIYFRGNDGTSANDVLWKSDGTDEGTVMVKNFSRPKDFTIFNDRIYFATSNGLAVSDGTETGTEIVLQQPVLGFRSRMTVVGDWLYFVSTDDVSTSGYELWRTDGTQEGTSLVKNIMVVCDYEDDDDCHARPEWLTEYNGGVYFTADDGVHGRELWKSDGTAQGTVMVKDIYVNEEDRTQNDIGHMDVANGLLFFRADDGVHGGEMWQSDGTESGTRLVSDIYPGKLTGVYSYYRVVLNNDLYFTANDGIHGSELWKTDGINTSMVVDIASLKGFGEPRDLILSDNQLYFSANTGMHGRELWSSDGTEAGTMRLNNINQIQEGSLPLVNNAINFNGEVYFTATDGENGRELWKTDGSEAGTQLVKNITTGSGDSYLGNLLFHNEELYFTVFESRNPNYTLWKTDGTETGTVLVLDLMPEVFGRGVAGISNLVSANELLFFEGRTDSDTVGIWRTDGTESGTIKLTDLAPKNIVGSANGVYFTTGTEDNDRASRLWKSDGTESGTELLYEVSTPHRFTDYFSNLTVFGDNLYFRGQDDVNGIELWHSDGTVAGTGLFLDINPGDASSYPSSFHIVNDEFYFSASDDGTPGLWKSDGTEQGTALVRHVSVISNSYQRNLETFNNGLVFIGDDGSGREVWKSDGTEQGTLMLRDISMEQYPIHQVLGVKGDTLYFRGDDETHGGELWKSDGTENGTVLVKDINEGEADGVIR